MTNEQTHCQCKACINGNIHDSDCSVHNGDALPEGPCDCRLAALAQPVQHREGHWCADLTCSRCYGADFRFKHTTPPQRQWVGLTDEEIDKWTPEIHGVIRAIEQALKEKNNG